MFQLKKIRRFGRFRSTIWYDIWYDIIRKSYSSAKGIGNCIRN